MAKLFSMSSAISQRPLRLKAISRRLTIIVHHPFDALPKENHLEIDQQGQLEYRAAGGATEAEPDQPDEELLYT
jgi:hypothetical protein